MPTKIPCFCQGVNQKGGGGEGDLLKLLQHTILNSLSAYSSGNVLKLSNFMNLIIP